MSSYTRIGVNLWGWPPFRDLPTAESKLLWLALYTAAESKRICPGLFQGSITTMSEISGLLTDAVRAALDVLIDRDMAEYDQRNRVLRLTMLPDAGESPTNGKVIRSWFARWKGVTACTVRDAHVTTLRRLLDDWCTESGKPLSNEHQVAWSETFATVKIPTRRASPRRSVQADLFDPPKPDLPLHKLSTGDGLPVATDREINNLVTISLPTGSGSGSGSSSLLLPEQSNGGAKEVGEHAIPPVALVPAMDDLPFSVTDMLQAIGDASGGRFAGQPLDGRLVEPLCATIRAASEAQVGLPDLRVVGEWLAAGGLGYRTDLGPLWLAKPGTLLEAVALARAWHATGRKVIGRLPGRSDLRRIEPAPLGAHGTGKRRL